MILYIFIVVAVLSPNPLSIWFELNIKGSIIGDKAHMIELPFEYNKLSPPSPNNNIDKTGYKSKIINPKPIWIIETITTLLQKFSDSLNIAIS